MCEEMRQCILSCTYIPKVSAPVFDEEGTGSAPEIRAIPLSSGRFVHCKSKEVKPYIVCSIYPRKDEIKDPQFSPSSMWRYSG